MPHADNGANAPVLSRCRAHQICFDDVGPTAVQFQDVGIAVWQQGVRHLPTLQQVVRFCLHTKNMDAAVTIQTNKNMVCCPQAGFIPPLGNSLGAGDLFAASEYRDTGHSKCTLRELLDLQNRCGAVLYQQDGDGLLIEWIEIVKSEAVKPHLSVYNASALFNRGLCPRIGGGEVGHQMTGGQLILRFFSIFTEIPGVCIVVPAVFLFPVNQLQRKSGNRDGEIMDPVAHGVCGLLFLRFDRI